MFMSSLESTDALRIANVVLAAICLLAVGTVIVVVVLEILARRRRRPRIPRGWPPSDTDQPVSHLRNHENGA